MGEGHGSRASGRSAFLLGLILAWSGAEATAAPWNLGGWLTAAGGEESDLTLDASPTPAIVPGGPFLAGIGGVNARVGSVRRTHLDLGAQGWYERFTAADDRTLLSATVAADFTLNLGRDWGVRCGAGGHLFDDTARPTSRRRAGWGEAGLVWSPRRLRLEVQGGAEGRRFPQLVATDASGAEGVYTENQAVMGAHAAVGVGSRVVLRLAWHERRTDARDPAYDATGPTVEAGADVVVGRGWRLLLDGFFQERTFTERPAGADQDRYRQVGAALEADLDSRWRVRGTVALSRYTWPEGPAVDTHRLQLSVTRRFGTEVRQGLPRPGDLVRDESALAPRAGRSLTFRVQAPQARSVALVGAFNGWDPAADPLQPVGDGWWETGRALPAGTHAYAYVVDGVWLTPPEAVATEDDGFGGRNGLIVVLP